MAKFNLKYLKEFKKLETELKRIANASSDVSRFGEILTKAKSKNPVVQFKEGIIWDLYGLRNVLAHADRDKYIAEVNELAFNTIKELLKLLEHPPIVGDIFKTKVYTTGVEDITEVVVKTMQRELYTHVPVYSGRKFVGVLSETTILDWLVENIKEGKAQFYKQKVGQINPKYLHPFTNRHKFISPRVSIFEVIKMFEDAVSKRERLGVIFITSSGRENEEPVGIITAWDLPKIKEYLK
jgi:CBS domain-containing protein